MLKNLCLLVFIISSVTVFGAKKKSAKYVIIKGHITQTSDYCGGVRPTDELIKNLKSPIPLVKKTIYIKIGTLNDGKTSINKKVITDNEGNFTVSLKSGITYMFLEDWKGPSLKIPENTKDVVWDHKCYRKRYETPDFILKVKNTANPLVAINYHNPCFYHPYCGEYSGPLPP